MKRSRRDFLRDSACGLTAAAMVSSLERLSLLDAMVPSPVANDYKALVCVFLSGGSDCNNMLIDINQFSSYAAVRGNDSTAPNLGLTQSMLVPISPVSGGSFGVH